MINERYLLMVANIAARDHTMLGLAVLAVGAMIWLPIVQTSPFIRSVSGVERLEGAYWIALLAAYTAGMIWLNTI